MPENRLEILLKKLENQRKNRTKWNGKINIKKLGFVS